jgi:restriction system protein
MRKGQPKLFDLLLDAPWWVSVLLALITYLFFTYVLPHIETSNPFINMFKAAFSYMGPLLSGLLLIPAPLAYFNARKKRKLLDTQSNLDSIKALSWKAFEELVAEGYRRQGYRVIENGFGPDGGVDIKLIKGESVTLVQCKQWRSRNVGVSVAREMFGVMTAEQAEQVIIICCGGFTADAIAFAKGKNLELVGGTALLAMVKGLQVTSQITPQLSPQTNSTEINDTSVCPNCGSALVERQAKRGSNIGNRFLGCSAFPKCRFILVNSASSNIRGYK